MNVLVFGASGATGHELVRQALNQGHKVTAFVRTPSKLKITHDDLKLVEGNVSQYPVVEQAIRGQDIIFSALGASNPFRFDQSVVEGISNIIQAMQHSVVKRLIYLSFIGVPESRNDGGFVIKYIAPKLLKTEIAGHELREKMIRKSELDWTIVRAPTLTKGPGKREYRSGEELKSHAFTVTISRADVADFMLKQMNDNSFIRKAVRIMY